MALTNAFHNAVTTGNIRRVRMMMTDSLLVDPSFREFNEREKAAATMHGLYDVHDGRALDENKANWNKDYMDKLMVQLIGNFSKERIAHVKNVVRYLYPVTEETSYHHVNHAEPKQAPKEYKDMSYQEKKRQDQLDGRYLGTEFFMGAVVGGAVGGVAASMAGVTIVGGVIVGAGVGGMVGAVIANGGH
jgi:hypothetical protein